MSAFFEWDTGLVEKALREKLAQMGHSLIPDDYADGYDESIGCEIDVPELLGKEFYTNTWDVSIECDYQEGIFMVAAYPIVDDEENGPYTETSAWITLVDIQVATVKVPVNGLEGDALDWAVTKAMGFDWAVWGDKNEWGSHGWATKWEQGGPIIQEWCIGLEYAEMGSENDWCAFCGTSSTVACGGPTPLIAAMRAFVAFQLEASEIEVPKGLIA
jgi:hypothetical protein